MIVQLCSPQFGRNLLLLFLDPVIIENYKDKLENFSRFIKNYPFLSFLFFHLLFCLTLLHYFTLYFTGLDLVIEVCYQFFNGLKILLVPLFIFSFVLANFPPSLLMEISPENYEAVKKTVATAAKETTEMVKKYPKTGAALLAGVGSLAVVTLEGQQQKNMIERSSMRGNPKDLDKGALDQSPELQSLQDQLFDLEHQADKSIVAIGFEQVKRTFSGQPTMSEEYHELQKQARHVETKTLGEIQREKELKEQQWREHIESLKQSGEIPNTSSTKAVVDYDSTTLTTLSPKIPTCLESFFDLF